jgi:hypothetical protein
MSSCATSKVKQGYPPPFSRTVRKIIDKKTLRKLIDEDDNEVTQCYNEKEITTDVYRTADKFCGAPLIKKARAAFKHKMSQFGAPQETPKEKGRSRKMRKETATQEAANPPKQHVPPPEARTRPHIDRTITPAKLRTLVERAKKTGTGLDLKIHETLRNALVDYLPAWDPETYAAQKTNFKREKDAGVHAAALFTEMFKANELQATVVTMRDSNQRKWKITIEEASFA